MEQAEILIRIEEVLGKENALHWLHQPNIALNGKTPAECIQTPAGMKEVTKILSAIESGGTV